MSMDVMGIRARLGMLGDDRAAKKRYINGLRAQDIPDQGRYCAV